MHLPDGFLDAKTAIAAGALSVSGIALALRQVRRDFPPRRVPLIGLAAAFIFAAQMLNFPVAGGTSGHLVGAVLAVVLLGPAAGVVVMTSVVVLQCFMFADGGLTALGGNLFNMAVAAPWVGYVVFAGVRRLGGGTPRATLWGAAFGAWCSTVAAAVLCAGELALSGTAPWRVVFPAMTWVHMLIGTGEGIITAFVVAAVTRLRPELLPSGHPSTHQDDGIKEGVAVGVLVALGLAFFVAPFASSFPDGLTRVAESLGFAAHSTASPVPAPLAGYDLPGLATAAQSTALAGGIGTIAAFLLAWLLARLLTPARRATPAP